VVVLAYPGKDILVVVAMALVGLNLLVVAEVRGLSVDPEVGMLAV
jgi:hypothetical protein